MASDDFKALSLFGCKPGMPPGPAYNWFCVAYSVLNILSHAAHHRAAQLAQNTVRATTAVSSKSRQEEPTKEPQHYTPHSRPKSTSIADHGLKSSVTLVPNATPSQDLLPDASPLHNDFSLDEPLHKVRTSVGIGPRTLIRTI